MATFFRQHHDGSRNSSTKPRRSSKPAEVPQIKPSKSGFELASSFLKKLRKERGSKYENHESREKASRSASSRAHSIEPQSKNAPAIASKDQVDDCHPTLLTSMKNGGFAFSTSSRNFKYYPVLPVKGVALTKSEKDGLNLEDSWHPGHDQLGYLPFGNAPDKIQKDVKKALKHFGHDHSELREPTGLVMTHSTFFDTALGDRRARWEQAIKDWESLGAKTRSWDWTHGSYAEFTRLCGLCGGQSFQNSRNRDAVIETDQQERSYSEGEKCGPNGFEDAITNLILKHTMFYCGDQTTQVAREASQEAESRFQKEREEKMKADRVDGVLRVARESKLKRNDRDRAKQQELLKLETANKVNDKLEKEIKQKKIKDAKSKEMDKLREKEENARSVEGKHHVMIFAGALALI